MLFQDLSDIEGDKKYQISTFASKFGVDRTAFAASSLLSLVYVSAALLPLLCPGKFKLTPMTLGHILAVTYLWKSYKNLISSDANSIRQFYKGIWNLFYFEYILYPFI